MTSTYQFWLLDDTGRKITMLQGFSFFSYSRSANGFGAFGIGLPFRQFREQYPPIFQPDLRVDVWRSPKIGIPMRRENTYFLRQPRIYSRDTDGIDIIVLYGRDSKDLLNRRVVVQPAGTSYTRKETYIDDMMKEIVREQMLFGSATDVDLVVDNTRAFPEDEFFVQGDQSLGPIYSKTFAERNVMDILRELHDASARLYDTNPTTNLKIYFDMFPVSLKANLLYILDEDTAQPIEDESGDGYLLDEESSENTSEQGFEFVTLAGLYGQDRTDGLVFSKENNNVKDIEYFIDHLEEKNSAIVKGFGRGDSRDWAVVDNEQTINLSRWNRSEVFVDASTEPDQDRLEDFGYPILDQHKPEERITATFLNVPGSEDTPESLYGIQWDLGDLLPVEYIGKRFDVEVDIVYVAMNEDGEENITGRSEINDAGN